MTEQPIRWHWPDHLGLTDAARIAEQNHPARLLGIAQVSIETALGMDDIDAIKQKLTADLARITPPAVTA
jgi:hypothetical protein